MTLVEPIEVPTLGTACDLPTLVDGVALRTGAWVLIERMGRVVVHGTGASPCPSSLAASLLAKSVLPLRAATSWSRGAGRRRGTADGVGVEAHDLGDGATAWFIAGAAEEAALPLLAAAVHVEPHVNDPEVEELLRPGVATQLRHAPPALLVALTSAAPWPALSAHVRRLVAGTPARVHQEAGLLLVVLPSGSDAVALMARLRAIVPSAVAGAAEVPSHATDWVATARLAIACAAAAGPVGVCLAEPHDGAVAAELVVQEARQAVQDLVRRLPTDPLRLLHEYDHRCRTDLIPTLTGWCRAGFDVNAAAKALHLHVNTVRYRLRRAAGISGLDVNSPQQRLALQLLL